jgi:predicted dehydrogenase
MGTDITRVGIVGVGNISGIYIKNLTAYSGTEIVACADLMVERAQAVASEHGIPNALSVDDLLSHPDVDVVLNLTIPAAHAKIARAALENGKHVYGEKPLAIELQAAREVFQLAAEKGLRAGCAPDTFLGGGHQTARAAIDRGEIGEPVGAHAAFMAHGPEDWHPNPDFFYQNGGGPMLDMGPYYTTALINLFGPVKRLSGSARASTPTRKVSLQNSDYYARADRAAYSTAGYEIPVETPTHYVATLDFANGAIVELCTSFDIWHHRHDWGHPITIFGTEGTMLVPDPNFFGGTVKVKRFNESEWRDLPTEFDFNGNARGLGLLDMAVAIREGRSHRASDSLALHALEIMLGVRTASEESRYVFPETQPERPVPMVVGEFMDPEKVEANA